MFPLVLEPLLFGFPDGLAFSCAAGDPAVASVLTSVVIPSEPAVASACPTNAKVPSATGVSTASGFSSVADLTSLLLWADLCDLIGVFAIVGILPVAGVPAIATVSAAANRGSVADDSDNHPCSCCRTKKSNMLDFQTMG
jgi:hypothetical protein